MALSRALALASLLSLAGSSAPALAEPAEDTELAEHGAPPAAEDAAPPAADGSAAWSTRGARTLPRGRWELALFGNSHYAVADGVELGVRPLLFLLLPHAEAKLRVLARGPFTFALRPQLSYPSPFLKLVSREGTGGLLPATTDVPQALQLEADAIASYGFESEQLASAWLGVAVAPRTPAGDFPLLDFPFLYPRFAPLYTGAVPRAGVALEGRAFGKLVYALELQAYLLPLPDLDGGYALEPAADLMYRFSRHFALELGLRTTLARYPVGTRFHSLPYVDAKVGF